MKFFFRLVIFFLSLLFLPHQIFAAEQPPLPQVKLKNAASGKHAQKAKSIKNKKSAYKTSKPLPEISLPAIWNSLFKTSKTKIPHKKSKPKKNKIAKKTAKPRAKKGQIAAIPLPVLKPAIFKTTSTPKQMDLAPSRKPAKTSELEKQLDAIAAAEKPIKAAIKLPPPLTKWSKGDIQSAQETCQKLLANLDVTVKPIQPIRFNRCGIAAPLKVSAMSEMKGQRVSINPPATMNCALTARMAKWIKSQLQPLANKHFSSPVKMIHNIASYSCRNRYNTISQKLSEHALGNALDIAGFTLENGEIISVLKHWPEEEDAVKSDFLKSVHKSACKTFVVVLGPNANEAHKNHFHFDLGRYPVCE